MSVKVSTWVWEHSQACGNDRFVLIALADHADDETWACWPSVARLARKTRLSERTVQRCIQNLQELGELSVELREGTSSRYVFLLPDTYPVVMARVGGGDNLSPLTKLDGGGVTKLDGGGVTSFVTQTINEPSLEPSLSASEEPAILLWIDQQCTRATGKGFHTTSPKTKRALQEQDSPGLRSQILRILEDAVPGRNVTSLITGLVAESKLQYRNGNGQPYRQQGFGTKAQRDFLRQPLYQDRPKPPSRMALALAAVAKIKLPPARGATK